MRSPDHGGIGGSSSNLAAVHRRVIASPSRPNLRSPTGRSAYRLVHTSAGSSNQGSSAAETPGTGDLGSKNTFAPDHGSVASAAAAEGTETRETMVQIRSTDEECRPKSVSDRRWEILQGHVLRHRKPRPLDEQQGGDQTPRQQGSRDVTVHDPIAAGEERPKRGKMVMFANEHGADRANPGIERGDIRPNFEADQQHLSPKTTTMSQLGLASTHSLLSESRPTPQYTLQARRRIHHGSVWGCLTAATSDYSTSADAISNGSGGCCHPNRVINQFFHWTFRTSFATLLVAFIVMFVLATMVFAGFILWAALDQPQCIASSAFSSISTRIAGEASTYGQRMADAYALSWTTFSTVGYGLIYPASTNEFDEQELCAGMILVCSVEGKFSSKGCRKTLYMDATFRPI